MKRALFSTLIWALAAAACGHTPGTRPEDMSVAEHEQAAEAADQKATEIAAEHTGAAPCTPENGRPCWSDEVHPSAEHVKEVQQQRALAEKHRAASQALRDAEARACAGLSEDDRDTSPFAHGSDIEGVKILREDVLIGKNEIPRDAGATIVFRATPGLTAQWLERLMGCHLARNAAVGHEMPEMPFCPLVPRGAEASVRSVGSGFAVDVRADDRDTAQEIWRRAQLIKTAPPSENAPSAANASGGAPSEVAPE